MGKTDEQLAAEQMYVGVSRPLNGREVCEDRDAADDLWRDEQAAKLMACGCPARDAVRYVAALMELRRSRDEQLCREVSAVRTESAADSLVAADKQEALRVMAARMVEATKPRFSAGCFLLAAGWSHPSVKSERQWAQSQDRSHTHACNEVREWQRILNLPVTSAQKSATARKVYKKTNGARAKHKTP